MLQIIGRVVSFHLDIHLSYISFAICNSESVSSAILETFAASLIASDARYALASASAIL